MIFSADLDRTLIYSRRRLEGGGEVVPAEYRLGEACGFITPGALEALRAVQDRMVCLVNTLRGLEQARRVDFVADGSCRYLALQKGLYLYRDGEEDPDWSRWVARTVAELPLDLAGGIQRVLKMLPGIECLSKQYQYLAVFFVEEAAFDDEACVALAGELASMGWELYRQRKKLYLSPLEIHKGTVLDRVRDLEDGAAAIGFGDSWFDLPMLRASTQAWAPKGCELDGTDWGFPLQFSSAAAQMGTEEVLTRILIGLGENENVKKP